eukprot:5065832-Pyramimonas_sp.AAC.1
MFGQLTLQDYFVNPESKMRQWAESVSKGRLTKEGFEKAKAEYAKEMKKGAAVMKRPAAKRPAASTAEGGDPDGSDDEDGDGPKRKPATTVVKPDDEDKAA